MLPFLKNKKEASMAEDVSDDHDTSEYGALDAIAEDMKKGHFKQALEALCDYIRSEDVEQDKSLTSEE